MSLADWFSPTSWIATALNAVGGKLADTVLGWHKASLDAANNDARIKAELAQRELAVQQTELQAQSQLRLAEIGKWYEPDKLMGYAVAIYFAKLLIWDKVFNLGSTDPLQGWAATTANLIVMVYFGKRGIENAMRILKR